MCVRVVVDTYTQFFCVLCDCDWQRVSPESNAAATIASSAPPNGAGLVEEVDSGCVSFALQPTTSSHAGAFHSLEIAPLALHVNMEPPVQRSIDAAFASHAASASSSSKRSAAVNESKFFATKKSKK